MAFGGYCDGWGIPVRFSVSRYREEGVREFFSGALGCQEFSCINACSLVESLVLGETVSVMVMRQRIDG